MKMGMPLYRHKSRERRGHSGLSDQGHDPVDKKNDGRENHKKFSGEPIMKDMRCRTFLKSGSPVIMRAFSLWAVATAKASA